MSTFQYLRAVTKSLALGTALAYQASPRLSGSRTAIVSAAGRCTPSGDSVAALTVSNGGQIHASYYQHCSPSLKIGVEMETDARPRESATTLGYETNISQTDFVLRGSVDANFVVRSVMMKKLTTLPVTLVLCSQLNHRTGIYQCGIGLTIEK